MSLEFYSICTTLHENLLSVIEGFRRGRKILKMGQTSDPETLVIHQKVTPGNNPGNFKQHLLSGSKYVLMWARIDTQCGGLKGVVSATQRTLKKTFKNTR
jgi:hypothetical protein